MTTPMKASIGHQRSLGSMPSSKGESRARERHEATELRLEYLKDNIRDVIDIAEPGNESIRQQAQHHAEAVSLLLSRLLPKDAESEAHAIINKSLGDQDEHAMTSVLVEKAAGFRQWIHHMDEAGGSSRASTALERIMYPSIMALFEFVTGCIWRLSAGAGAGADNAQPLRRILPFRNADRNPKYSEDRSRIDLGLTCEALDGNDMFQRDDASDDIEMPMRLDKPSYRRLFAIVEAKGGATSKDQAAAFDQLIQYSKNAYAVQHNRRFVWGITVCGAVAKVCAFGPNFMLASTAMDLTSEGGRSELIRLIACWSFCELDKLGYDPSVRFSREHGCIEIDVALAGNGDMESMQTFYSRDVITVAERMFGRHTRCFIAHKDPESAAKRASDPENGIIIKDAWPEATE
ncbi:hypothetical protein IWW36_005534, partial [Coemansia brasiliensis]